MAAALKKKAAEVEDADVNIEKLFDEIAYIPGPGDPSWTKWNGIEFRANTPVKVPRAKTVQATTRQQMQLGDGTVVSRGVETRIPMAELAKENPCFSVNGVAPTPRKPPTARLPTDSNQYRSYATEWIGRSRTAAEMDTRWEGESELRTRCGVDERDLQHIRPFFDARHDDLAQATE